MEIMTRGEAAKKGLTKYFTGVACKHGHVAQRYTLSGNCLKCASKAGNVYATQIKAARFGEGMVELKATTVHKDDLAGIEEHIAAVAAARALVTPSPAPQACIHGVPPGEVCQTCDIGG